MRTYLELEFAEVERLFRAGESIFYQDLERKVNDYATKKYLEDTFHFNYLNQDGEGGDSTTTTRGLEARDLKYANEHYQMINDP